MSKEKENSSKKDVLALALGIALLPPIWAVISPHIGISTGAVSLICAAVYVANGNKIKDSIKITVGFIMGLLWGGIALSVLSLFPDHQNIALFTALFVLGGCAVIIASTIAARFIFLPSWLCGWAITLQILGGIAINDWGNMPLSIGISMVVGVFYVGAGVDKFQNVITKKLKK